MFSNRISQSGDNSLKKCKLFDVEWERVKHILELLKPLYIATVIIKYYFAGLHGDDQGKKKV